jgi:ABC-2 type transport system permease protein
MRAMILKELRELRRDRRTLGMLVGMPVLLLVIFGYAANFSVDSLTTALVGPRTDTVTLPSIFDVVRTDPDPSTAQDLVRDNVADVVVDTSTTPATVYLDGSALFAAQTASAVLAKAAQNPAAPPFEVTVLYNPDLKTSWVMVPALVGLVLSFIGTIITSIGMVRERAAGTLDQLAVMPLRPTDVVLGKIVPYFLLAAIDMAAVTVLGVLIFGVPFVGDVWLFVLGALIFLFVVLGLGVLISTVSQTQAQAIQGAIMVMLPQVLLSGFIFPLSSMAAGIRWIGYGLPLTYFVQISQGIMLRGASLSSLWLPFVVLAGMALLIFTGAVLRFRRDLAGNR